MTCRHFHNQLAEWHSGRLAPADAQGMAAHQQTCDRCAAASQSEEHLRELWVTARAMPASPDLWPRIVRHLDTQDTPLPRTVPAFRLPKRAWVGAVLAAGMVGAGLSVAPKEWTSLPHLFTTSRTETVKATPKLPSNVVLSVLPDAARLDPAVDDPAGTSIENVWAQIKPGGAAKASSE